MREILFRGKRTNDGRWIDGYYMHHLNRMASPIGDGIKPEDEDHIILYDGFADWNMPRDIVYTHVDPESVCQYTGLRDKNGKRIFEGDIVIFKTTNYHFEPCVVEYHNDVAQFVVSKNGRSYPMADDFSYEVIGNIYDHKELLDANEV